VKLVYPLGTNYNGIKSTTEIKISCPKGTNSSEVKFIKTRLVGEHLFFEFEMKTNQIKELCNTAPPRICGIDTKFGRIELSTL
jgi:hypothetical protein